jgi:hypothetical protein
LGLRIQLHVLTRISRSYDFVLSTRKPAPAQQNMSTPGTAPGYATMPGLTKASRLRSTTPSTSEVSLLAVYPLD